MGGNEIMHFKPRLILRRLLEIFVTGTIISVLATLLCYVLEGNYTSIIIATLAADIIFFVVCFIQIKNFRFAVPRLKNFYVTNFIAFGIYCAVAVLFALIIHFTDNATRDVLGHIYTYLFYIFKTFRYLSYSYSNMIGLTTSAVIFSGICMVFVLVSPPFIRKKRKVFADRIEGRNIKG